MEPSRSIRCAALLALCAALAAAPARAADADDPARSAVFGIWASSGSMIEVRPLGDSLSARIIALKHPAWREQDGVGRIGEPKTDLRNPDRSKHDQPLVGLELLSGYRFRDGRWRGRVYLPTRGNSWTSTMRVKDGELRLRGYAALPMLGKTQSFAPLSSCKPNILRMLARSEVTGTPCDELLDVGE